MSEIYVSEEEELLQTPPELKNIAHQAEANLLPAISKDKYMKCYDNFEKWLKEKKAPITENVLLCYFTELAEKLQPSSLWSIHSRLKATIKLHRNIDISSFTKVISLLKRKKEGHESKSATPLSEDEVKTFIELAPDDIHLAHKVSKPKLYAN